MHNSDLNSPTLFELLRPVRTRWWVLVGLIVIAVGVALALSASQSKQYAATASYQLQSQNQVLGTLAVPTQFPQTPAQLASQGAQTVLQPAVVQRAKRSLPRQLTNTNFANAISASANPNSTNVDVTATASTPNGAAALANAFATAAVQVTNQEQRNLYAADAARVARYQLPKQNLAGKALQQQEVARLQQLAAIATPAQIVASAAPPGSPSSPKPVRNAAIAGVLGLMVGLLVIYVWDALDRRLRSADDIERHFGFPLVGRVREEALGQSPNTGDRGHAVDPIDWEQFRILRRNIEFLGTDGGPRVIAVTSAVPEEGKTTVASFIAFANAAAGKRTLLIECDLRRPVFAKRLGIRAAPGVSDYVTETASPSELLQVISFDDVTVTTRKTPAGVGAGSHSSSSFFSHSLVCMTAGSPTSHPAEVLESAAFRKMLDEVRTAYDIVVLDTPPVLAVVDPLEVLDSADAIILCGRESKVTRDQVKAGKRLLERASGKLVCLVVTGVRASRHDYSYYGYYYDGDRESQPA